MAHSFEGLEWVHVSHVCSEQGFSSPSLWSFQTPAYPQPSLVIHHCGLPPACIWDHWPPNSPCFPAPHDPLWHHLRPKFTSQAKRFVRRSVPPPASLRAITHKVQDQDLETALCCITACYPTFWSNFPLGAVRPQLTHQLCNRYECFHGHQRLLTTTSLHSGKQGSCLLHPGEVCVCQIITICWPPILTWTEGLAFHLGPPTSSRVPQADSAFVGLFEVDKVIKPSTIPLKLTASLPVHPTFHASQLKSVSSSELCNNIDLLLSSFD